MKNTDCGTDCWDLADHLCDDGQLHCFDHCECDVEPPRVDPSPVTRQTSNTKEQA